MQINRHDVISKLFVGIVNLHYILQAITNYIILQYENITWLERLVKLLRQGTTYWLTELHLNPETVLTFVEEIRSTTW